MLAQWLINIIPLSTRLLNYYLLSNEKVESDKEVSYV
jgi:hypothetical protein